MMGIMLRRRPISFKGKDPDINFLDRYDCYVPRKGESE
jgi:hypothetical protein